LYARQNDRSPTNFTIRTDSDRGRRRPLSVSIARDGMEIAVENLGETKQLGSTADFDKRQDFYRSTRHEDGGRPNDQQGAPFHMKLDRSDSPIDQNVIADLDVASTDDAHLAEYHNIGSDAATGSQRPRSRNHASQP
jgi:hypothetical protein